MKRLELTTKLQPGVPRVTAYLPADFGVDSINGLCLASF
jgi:hypothetical protein